MHIVDFLLDYHKVDAPMRSSIKNLIADLYDGHADILGVRKFQIEEMSRLQIDCAIKEFGYVPGLILATKVFYERIQSLIPTDKLFMNKLLVNEGFLHFLYPIDFCDVHAFMPIVWDKNIKGTEKLICVNIMTSDVKHYAVIE